VEKKRLSLLAVVLAGFATAGFPCFSQSAEVFFQAIEGATARQLTIEEKARLQDPLFKLVLAPRPDATKLIDIEGLILGTNPPDPMRRRIFVVDEEIKDPRQPQARRAVIDFLGTNGGIQLDGRIMLSIFFTSAAVPEAPDIEAWAFDEQNGVFNYYKLDRQGQTTPALSWKFRASSDRADSLPLTASDRAGTCLRCHTSGVPVMKELALPWNNWQSGQSPNDYLTRSGPAADRWPVANDSHFSKLVDAYSLESTIETTIRSFAIRKFDKFVQLGDRDLNVQNAKAVLRPLFDTTEINFTSARQLSGLHPLSPGVQTGPDQPIVPPNGFFLMSGILTSLGVADAAGFNSIAVIQPAEYKGLVAGAGLKITRNSGASFPGDANFAWFTPEPGFAATNWIDMLVQRKVLSPAFVAAALALDIEMPIFSERRKTLLDFIPDTFTVTPGDAHPDRLTRDVIQRLQDANPPSGSAAREFLDLLTQSKSTGCGKVPRRSLSQPN
jgi:hypothetical protein